jgi:hypothetical protein
MASNLANKVKPSKSNRFSNFIVFKCDILTKRKMMKQLSTLVLALSFLFTIGCDAADKHKEQIAKEICDCMRPLFRSYNSIKAAREDNDSEALQRFVEEMEAANEEVSACAGRVEAQYGTLEGKREEQVKAAMQKVCPEVIATLNEVESALMQ